MGIARFREAQDSDGTYRRALFETQAGQKRSHWIWFVFPQLAGLGSSSTARFYALADIAEARGYLADPVLRERLREITAAACQWAGKRDLREIFGGIDALKFVSSMTLFEAAAGTEDRKLFADALDRLAEGERDPRTLSLLGVTRWS